MYIMMGMNTVVNIKKKCFAFVPIIVQIFFYIRFSFVHVVQSTVMAMEESIQ